MKALILAGGQGERLKPLTDDLPKSLIKIGQKTILEIIIDSLVNQGVKKMVFLLGYQGKAIQKYVKNNYNNLKTVFVFDPPEKPASSSYIYSMWYGRKYLKNDDLLYIHGDIFCDPILIERIIKSSHSGALVNKTIVSEKDFNAEIEEGLIRKIGVSVSGKQRGFCLPVYKFLKDEFGIWMKKIEEYIKKGRIDCYAENALNEVTDKIKLYPVYFDKEMGMEIDDFEDLRKAKSFLTAKTKI